MKLTGELRVWTVPNALSLARLLGVPVFLWLVLGPEADGWALLLLMFSGITDFLDGYLARRLNQHSRLGEVLDPVADRCYILAVVFGLAIRGVIPWWLALLLPARDLFLIGLVPFLRRRGYSALPVHFLGKAATFNLLYAFPLLLLGDVDTLSVGAVAKVFGWAMAGWGLGLYWWAGILYAVQVYRLLQEPTRAPEDPPAPKAAPGPVPVPQPVSGSVREPVSVGGPEAEAASTQGHAAPPPDRRPTIPEPGQPAARPAGRRVRTDVAPDAADPAAPPQRIDPAGGGRM